MPESLPSTHVAEKNKLHSIHPNICFVEIPIDATNAFRICLYNEDVTIYEATADGIKEHKYDGFSFVVPDIELRADGTIPNPTISISNIGVEVLAFIQANSSNLKGKNIRLFYVNIQYPGNSGEACTPFKTLEGKIRRIIIKANAIEFPIGFIDLHTDTIPGEYYERGYCSAGYGPVDARCNFPIAQCSDGTTAFGVYNGYQLQFVKANECDHGLYTPNGCAAHAALAAFHHAQWMGNVLPFRGFPGLVKGKGY